MIFSKDYIGYLARQTTKHLVAVKMIKTDKPELTNQRVGHRMRQLVYLVARDPHSTALYLRASSCFTRLNISG